jgi:hypothetical protein
VEFQGFGLVERAERIVQIEPATGLPFANYSFDVLILDLLAEDEMFDWRWINDRRDPELSSNDTLRLAPEAWREWVKAGNAALPRLRRAVSKQQIVKREQQRPPRGSREEKILRDVYRYYEGRKARFEALAALVAERVIAARGTSYRTGWITQAGGDHGIDFVGRLDIGRDLAGVRLVVLGQAKCEDPDTPTNGVHIARTVARLRRGWIGVYVTTSFFSDATQREVIDDQYPIVLIDGYRLATELGQILSDQGLQRTEDLLEQVDAGYSGLLARRTPEEILLTP